MTSSEIIARRSGGLALSLLLIFIAGINFSFLFSVNKVAAEAGVPFFAYVFWYALGAGLVLAIVAAIRGEQLESLAQVQAKSFQDRFLVVDAKNFRVHGDGDQT